ncbi:MAG TPA: hypothetical protein VGD78_05000, partial [Chthoniobacterales bacterium]
MDEDGARVVAVDSLSGYFHAMPYEQQLLTQVLLRTPRDAAQTEPMARELAELLQRSAEVACSLAVELSPAVLSERGLAAALEWLADRMHRQHRIEVAVEVEASAEPEAADLREFLFRAVRELLLNAVKHAGGSPVRITLSRGGKRHGSNRGRRPGSGVRSGRPGGAVVRHRRFRAGQPAGTRGVPGGVNSASTAPRVGSARSTCAAG